MANKIVQLKDSNNNNIYPIGYAQGGMKMDLLWTNPNQSANFSTQTISIDLSLYDIIIIDYSARTTPVGVSTEILPKQSILVDRYLITANPYDGKPVRRLVRVTDNSVVFGGGQYCPTLGGTGWNNGDECVIPYRIYGIKLSYIVPTEVQGLQYTEDN